MVISRRTGRQIMKDEVLDERVSQFLNRVDTLMGFGNSDGDEQVQPRRTPDITERLRQKLKAHFEDEIVPAIPSEGGGYIDETELNHELAKKALIGLKLSRLREGSHEIGAQVTGARTAEDYAAAIAKALEWDDEAVADFVLQHEEEPTDNSGHGVRLYALDSKTVDDADQIESAIQALMGRYIRVGIARWYVFDDLQRLDDSISLYGKYMAYNADVDATKTQATLRSIPKIQIVVATIVSSRSVVEVSNVPVNAARAAVFAASAVLGHEMLGHVPNADSDAERVSGKVHGSAEFLLSVLQDRLPNAGVKSVNPTIARFKMDTRSSPNGANIPTLKAVRFEGTHILDSVPACRFIAEEGRPLASISFSMGVQFVDIEGFTITSSFPVKISLESDHVQIVTGLGNDPIRSKEAHGIVTSAVWDQVVSGLPEPSSLNQLIQRMEERAASGEISDRATILSIAEGDNED